MITADLARYGFFCTNSHDMNQESTASSVFGQISSVIRWLWERKFRCAAALTLVMIGVGILPGIRDRIQIFIERLVNDCDCAVAASPDSRVQVWLDVILILTGTCQSGGGGGRGVSVSNPFSKIKLGIGPVKLSAAGSKPSSVMYSSP